MLGKKEWLVLWAKLLQLYRSREGSQSVDKKNWLYGWWTFDQCGFWLTMLFWVNKIDKILHPKKPPVHLRWSWHWFSLTENFWTWLSETRSRGGARRAAEFLVSDKVVLKKTVLFFFFFFFLAKLDLFFRGFWVPPGPATLLGTMQGYQTGCWEC